jgi:hypothetical protein
MEVFMSSFPIAKPGRFIVPVVLALVTAALVLCGPGCGGDKTTNPQDNTPPVLDSTAVPDFQLADVNPNSPTYGHRISPRDYIGKVSGWYFGNAG